MVNKKIFIPLQPNEKKFVIINEVVSLDDEKILDLFFKRDEAAISAAKDKFGARLFLTAKNILDNREDAEECVNDSLFKAWQSIPPLRPAFPGAYLVKIARNHALNKWNARNAAKRGGGEVPLLINELEECVPSMHHAEPERVFERGQTTAAVNTFLIKADKTARALFVLRYFHGERVADIATHCGMSESKVKSILFRLRKKLRTQLEKEGIPL
ncbi:MAG: RNA polymerase sigma factor [Defluviitaleaceae bacterium]|nr:RNA polymerase sigma factor [Defluviitaleaceae bacterium]MCL2240502.1 RNA polymerase sigma factor [Defluviitaleaceae bacterium]